MLTALEYALQVLEALPALIGTGSEVANLISDQTALVKEMVATNTAPTAAQWSALNTQIQALLAELKD